MTCNLPSYLVGSPFGALFKQSTSPPLPSAWNHGDSSVFIQVGKNRLRAKYIGAGRDDTEAAAIRTYFPIPQECGLYYYEVEIINKGVGG
ncbi:11171_t:CDS:2 [Paraglomus brasilianum]|uniref:11171_t:CDS:1 n=1 Tax=Paraglomus brasilianum TaxID=144538 RepID=A0A9N9B6R0_9GLOM|nr:11171_t:CDS:2 [Paraglomus brasilianum]